MAGVQGGLLGISREARTIVVLPRDSWQELVHVHFAEDGAAQEGKPSVGPTESDTMEGSDDPSAPEDSDASPSPEETTLTDDNPADETLNSGQEQAEQEDREGGLGARGGTSPRIHVHSRRAPGRALVGSMAAASIRAR